MPYGASGGLGDNVTNLAAGAASGLGIINAELLGLVTPLGDILLPSWTITPGTGATGTISRYLICAEGTSSTPGLWTGNLNPITTANATALAAMLAYTNSGTLTAFIDSVTVTSSYTTYHFLEKSVYGLFSNIPRFVSVILFNNTNLNLSSTAANHSTTFIVDSYT